MKKLIPLFVVCGVLVIAVAVLGFVAYDHQNQITGNNDKAQTAIEETAEKAATDLATAKAALEALVAAGDKANADALTAAIADLNAAIDAAEAAAEAADGALKTELNAAIAAAKAEATAAVEALKAELTAKIDTAVAALEAADAEDAAALAKAITDLNKAIDDAEAAATAADTALDTKLTAAIAEAKAEAAAAVAALETKLTAKIDTAVTELKAADKKNADDLLAKAKELSNAIAAAEAAAKLADTALETKLTAAIADAKAEAADAVAALDSKLTAKIDAAVAELKAADKKNADDLLAAIATLGEAIEDAKTVAALADTALETKLTAAVDAAKAEAAAAVAALETKITTMINDAVAALEAADAKNANDLAAAIADLNAAIDAAEAAAVVADTALETKLTAAVDAAKAEAAAAVAALKDELTKAIEDAVADLEAADAEDAAALAKAIADLNAAIDAAEAAAEAADAALDTKFTAAIDAAKAEAAKAVADLKAELTDKIDSAVADLEAAIDKKVDATEYAAKIAELDSAIGELMGVDGALDDTFATDADVAAKLDAAVATLNTAIADLEKDLQEKIDALDGAVADLQSGKANASDVVAEITRLDAAIVAAQAAAENTAKLANDELKATIEALDATTKEAIAKIEAEYIKIENWDAATETIIKELVGLEEAYANFMADTKLYDNLPQDVKTKVLTVYTDAKVRLYRAVSVEAALSVGENARELFDAIVNVYKVYSQEKYNNIYYYEAGQKALKKHLADAYREIVILDTFSADVTVIAANLEVKLDAVDTKADYIYMFLTNDNEDTDINYDVYPNNTWKNTLEFVEFKLNGEGDLADKWAALAEVKALYLEYKARYDFLMTMKAQANAIHEDMNGLFTNLDLYGYNAANKAEFESIVARIEAWYAELGETSEGNKNMIKADRVELITVKYEALQAEYVKAATDLKAKLDAFNTEYVYIYNADLNAIVALFGEANAWTDDVLARGFALDGEVEAPVADAITAFNNGAHARALALEAAYAEAEEIERLIALLTADIENMTKIKSEYQVRYNAIVSAVAEWNDTYFADYADEAVAGNTNYDLLDHAAYDVLVELYDTEISAFIAKANAVIEAINKLDVITVMSGKDIESARKLFNEFVSSLGDLGYDIDGIGTPGEILAIFTAADVKFTAMCAQAVEDYSKLTVLTEDTVNVYNKAEIDALVEWYVTYFNLDATSDDVVFPEGQSYKLADDLTINSETFESVKAAYVAFVELRAEKDTDLKELVAAADALLGEKACTNLRGQIEDVKAIFTAWLDGTYVPAGYTADQFAGKAEDIADKVNAVAEYEKFIITLEKNRDDLITLVKNLTKSYKDLTNTTAIDEYAKFVETLELKITDFVGVNNGYDADFVAINDYVVNAWLNIAQARAIVEVTECRKAKEHADVTAVLDKALEDAKDAIGKVTAESEIKAIIEAAKARFELIYNVATAKVEAINGLTDLRDNFDHADVVAELDDVYNTAVNAIKAIGAEDAEYVAKIAAIVDPASARLELIYNVATAKANAIAELNNVREDNDFADAEIQIVLDDVLNTAVDAIKAIGTEDAEYVAKIDAIAPVAMADLVNVFNMATACEDVFVSAAGIANDNVSKDIIARATASRMAAVEYIVKNHTTVGAEYDLEVNEIEILRYTIVKYNAFAAVNPADAASIYTTWAGQMDMRGYENLEDLKGMADNFFEVQ